MGNVEDKLYDFSEAEIIEVRNKFPKLTLKSKGAREGQVDIDAVFNNHHVQDIFNIGILVSVDFPNELPALIELGGRTDAIAQKYNIKDKRDLHCDAKTGIVCLCVKQEEKVKFPPDSTLVDFIENLVIPYLFGLSFYEKNGYWIWGEYSHGALGVLEYCGENQNTLTIEEIDTIAKVIRSDKSWVEYSKQIRKPSSEKYCICGSKKPIRKCHSLTWKGIQHVHNELARLNLNPKTLFNR